MKYETYKNKDKSQLLCYVKSCKKKKEYIQFEFINP